MKRGGPLRRGGPLARSQSLTRAALPRRAKPMPVARAAQTPAERHARAVVRARSGGVCEVQIVCRGMRAQSFHHRLHKGQGGPWTGSNGLDTCGDGTTGCHGWVEHNPTAAKARGWWVEPWQNPANIGVDLAGIGRVYLNDKGSFTQEVAA